MFDKKNGPQFCETAPLKNPEWLMKSPFRSDLGPTNQNLKYRTLIRETIFKIRCPVVLSQFVSTTDIFASSTFPNPNVTNFYFQNLEHLSKHGRFKRPPSKVEISTFEKDGRTVFPPFSEIQYVHQKRIDKKYVHFVKSKYLDLSHGEHTVHPSFPKVEI